jgi:Na+/melibiose symporter-like transporter
LLLLLAAVPAKVILIAYCFYLIPLYIVSAGSTPAMAGRMIMLYSVMMVLLVPVMANWVVTLRARHRPAPEAQFVAAGLALSGLAGLAMALPFGLLSPLLLVFLLGIGQALSISPQAAMVAEVCHDEIRTLGQSAVYGIYRMVERFGNAIGPLIAAALLELAGFQTAFVAIGGAVLVCAAGFALVFMRPAAGAPVAAVARGAD